MLAGVIAAAATAVGATSIAESIRHAGVTPEPSPSGSAPVESSLESETSENPTVGGGEPANGAAADNVCETGEPNAREGGAPVALPAVGAIEGAVEAHSAAPVFVDVPQTVEDAAPPPDWVSFDWAVTPPSEAAPAIAPSEEDAPTHAEETRAALYTSPLPATVRSTGDGDSVPVMMIPDAPLQHVFPTAAAGSVAVHGNNSAVPLSAAPSGQLPATVAESVLPADDRQLPAAAAAEPVPTVNEPQVFSGSADNPIVDAPSPVAGVPPGIATMSDQEGGRGLQTGMLSLAALATAAVAVSSRSVAAPSIEASPTTQARGSVPPPPPSAATYLTDQPPSTPPISGFNASPVAGATSTGMQDPFGMNPTLMQPLESTAPPPYSSTAGWSGSSMRSLSTEARTSVSAVDPEVFKVCSHSLFLCHM